MWRNLTIVVACLCVSALSYTVSRSNQVANYHYTPPVGARLELPINHQTASQSNQQQQQHQQQQPYQANQRQYKSYSQQPQQQPSVPQSATLTSQGYNTESAAPEADHNAESVRLPLPLGVASINIAPLPLMEGFSYMSSHGLTSYGTPYPQKRL